MSAPTAAATASAGGRFTLTHVCVAVLTAAMLVWSTTAINDLDSIWHVRIGHEILTHHQLSNLGQQWTAAYPGDWKTSQWGAEVGMAAVVSALGWKGLIGVRLILLALTLALTASIALRWDNPLLRVPLLMPVWFCLLVTVQDRPQTAAFTLLAGLSVVIHQRWREPSRTPFWAGHTALALGTLLFAQLHGLWILVPASLVLAGIRTGSLSRARGWLISAAASAAAGSVNPWGPESFLLPHRFADATANLAEWKPTLWTSSPTWGLSLLIVITVAAFARCQTRVPAGDLLWLGAWTIFATLAFRNLAPAALMITPLAMDAVSRSWGSTVALPTSSPAQSRRYGAAIVAIAAVGLALVALRLLTLNPLAAFPEQRIGTWLGAQPEPVRVLNAYNVSSSLLLHGHNAAGQPNVRLLQDGRADLWGGPYLQKMTDLQNLAPGWRQSLAQAQPQAAVLPRRVPLVDALTHSGWRVVVREGKYVLLIPSQR